MCSEHFFCGTAQVSPACADQWMAKLSNSLDGVPPAVNCFLEFLIKNFDRLAEWSKLERRPNQN